MARQFYKDGTSQQFKNRKEKFGRYNIKNDLNSTVYSYQLKSSTVDSSDGSTTDIGVTLSDFLKRIRTQGDTELTINLTKDKNLFPAGRLKVLKGETNESPVFATDDEGGVFANSQNLSYVTNLDILNLGGRDQMRFLSEQELLTPDPIPGDMRTVGISSFSDSDSAYSFNVSGLEGYTLAVENDYGISDVGVHHLIDNSTKTVAGEYDSTGYVASTTTGEKYHDLRVRPGLEDYFFFLQDKSSSAEEELSLGVCIYSNTSDSSLCYAPNSEEFDIKDGKRASLSINSGLNVHVKVGDDYKIFQDSSSPYTDLDVVESYEVDGEVYNDIVASTKRYSFLWGQELTKDEGLPEDFEYIDNNFVSREVKTNYFISSMCSSVGKDIPKAGMIIENGVWKFVIFNKETGEIDKAHEFTSFNNTIRGGTTTIEYHNGYFMVLGNLTGGTVDDYTAFIATFDSDLNLKVFDSDNETNPNEYKYYAKSGIGILKTDNSFTFYMDGAVWKMKTYSDSLPQGSNNLLINYDSTAIGVSTTGLVDDYLGFRVMGSNAKTILYKFVQNSSNSVIYDATVITDSSVASKEEELKIFFTTTAQNGNRVSNRDDGLTYVRCTTNLDNDYEIQNEFASGELLVFGESAEDFKFTTGIEAYNIDLISREKMAVRTYDDTNRISIINITKERPTVEATIVLTSGAAPGLAATITGGWTDGGYLTEKIAISTTDNGSGNKEVEVFSIFEYSPSSQHIYRFKDNIPEEEKIILEEPDHPLWANCSESIVDSDTALFGMNGGVIGIGTSGVARYEKIESSEGELLDVVALKYDPNNDWVIGVGMPYDGTLLKPITDYPNTQAEIFAVYKTGEIAVSPRKQETTFGGINYTFEVTNNHSKPDYRNGRFLANNFLSKISIFENEQVLVSGHLINEDGERRDGILKAVWGSYNSLDSSVRPFGDEDRTEDYELPPEVTGQQIYLTRSSRVTPNAAGGFNHYSIDASRVDIPKFKNSDGKFITMNFVLDAAVKGENVKYIDLESDAWIALNQIQFLDENEEELSYEIADIDFETGENARDEEMLNPNLFNDGHGNEAWNLMKAYPIINGSDVKWEFTDITTKRYYDVLWEQMRDDSKTEIEKIVNWAEGIENFWSDTGQGINDNISATMMNLPDTSYMHIGTDFGKFIAGREFSSAFLTAMYRGTVGAGITSGDGEAFATNNSGNFGLDVADNRFYYMAALVNEPPTRRWENTEALYVMDSFLVKGTLALEDRFYISKMLPNPVLFDLYTGAHSDRYKALKNEHLNGSVTWNGTLFDQKFINSNNGTLSTVSKTADVTTWDVNNSEDRKFLLLVPNDLEQIADAIKRSEVGESPQAFEQVTVVSGFFEGITAPRIDLPVAEGMYSRLDQEVFVNSETAESLGLRTNSKIRLVFDRVCAPNRIRVNGYGGNTWTWTEYDANFNLAKDSSNSEVPPRTVQSPNVNLTPADSFKDDLLAL